MKILLATLLLGLAAPGLLFGQANPPMPMPSAIAGARQKLIQLRKEFLKTRVKPPVSWPVPKECEPGPAQTVLDLPGWFEGMDVAHNGDIYTSDQVTLNVYRITPKGEVSLFAHLFDQADNQDAAVAGTLGMQFSRNGDLWIAGLDFADPTKHGIYRVAHDGHSELAIPLSLDEIPGPNGLAFDPQGDLYFTECLYGAIWKVARGQSAATLWLASDLLVPPPDGVFGANGIVYKDQAFFVVNTDKGTLLKVPVNHDGSPGEPTVLASGLAGPDGVCLGPCSDLYIACPYGGQLVRIANDGSVNVLLENLVYPTTPAFGKPRGHGDGSTVYLTNFLSSQNGAPCLYKVELCPNKCGD